jgi:hypothetical protein
VDASSQRQRGERSMSIGWCGDQHGIEGHRVEQLLDAAEARHPELDSSWVTHGAEIEAGESGQGANQVRTPPPDSDHRDVQAHP